MRINRLFLDLIFGLLLYQDKSDRKLRGLLAFMKSLVSVIRTFQFLNAMPYILGICISVISDTFKSLLILNSEIIGSKSQTSTIVDGIKFQFLFSNPERIERLLPSILFLIQPRRGRIPNHLFY